jgi:hypothetical protein
MAPCTDPWYVSSRYDAFYSIVERIRPFYAVFVEPTRGPAQGFSTSGLRSHWRSSTSKRTYHINLKILSFCHTSTVVWQVLSAAEFLIPSSTTKNRSWALKHTLPFLTTSFLHPGMLVVVSCSHVTHSSAQHRCVSSCCPSPSTHGDASATGGHQQQQHQFDEPSSILYAQHTYVVHAELQQCCCAVASMTAAAPPH